jgi:hypothetical protein
MIRANFTTYPPIANFTITIFVLTTIHTMINRILLIILVVTAQYFQSCNNAEPTGLPVNPDSGSEARPYTRWWWFASVIHKKDITHQLNWLKKNGFGGVEIAFIYPVNRDPNAARTGWLSPEWTEKVSFTKRYADKLGLACDFTFGTLWPFGGTFVPKKDATKIFADPAFRQPLRLSWTHPDTGNVIDHMNRGAFQRYAQVMGNALKPALTGKPSALFCDSWEVETRCIWTDGFAEKFISQFGYDIQPFMPRIYSEEFKHERYDYMKLVSQLVLDSFYIPFTEKCHELGAVSRVQCAGSPTDLIEVYATVDIPETEAMLYEPGFSAIVASAAALAGKSIVSSETFTCLYGFPATHHLNEQTADLKMVADALFANGVNRIIWHGMPYNPAGVDSVYFYATVHVGQKGKLAPHLKDFNDYMTTVSSVMQKGKTYSDIAVYLPVEDAWIAGEYPEELQMKWSWGQYEMRYLTFPDELSGYHPLWINRSLLESLEIKEGLASNGECSFSALVVTAAYLDIETLEAIHQLARQGLKVCFTRLPGQAGKIKSDRFEPMLKDILELPGSASEIKGFPGHPPMVEGSGLPDFWCRRTGEDIYLFFAHPKAFNLKLPLSYGFSFTEDTLTVPIVIRHLNHIIPYQLRFEPYQSLLIKVSGEGIAKPINIHYLPPLPEKL